VLLNGGEETAIEVRIKRFNSSSNDSPFRLVARAANEGAPGGEKAEQCDQRQRKGRSPTDLPLQNNQRKSQQGRASPARGELAPQLQALLTPGGGPKRRFESRIN